MVLGQVSYEPIKAVRLLGGLGFPVMLRVPENALETFVIGAPLVMSGGYLQECAFGGAEIVYGVAAENAHYLATDGLASDGYSEGSPQNQPTAKIIPVGAWAKDGKIGIYAADGKTVFSAALKAGQVFTQAMVNTTYGITKDATSGFWYVDNTDVAGDNVVAKVLGVDDSAPNTTTGGARVFFQFLSTLRAFS